MPAGFERHCGVSGSEVFDCVGGVFVAFEGADEGVDDDELRVDFECFLEEALSAGGGVEWWPGGELVVVQMLFEGRVW